MRVSAPRVIGLFVGLALVGPSRAMQGGVGPYDEGAGALNAQIEVLHDVPYAPSGWAPHPNQRLDLYVKPVFAKGPSPVVVFVHGGNFFSGTEDIDFEDPVWLDFLDRGWAIAAVHYRLSPKECDDLADPLNIVYPAHVEDISLAVQFLRTKAAAWNLDPERMCLYGRSAGSTLAAWVALADDLASISDGVGHGGLPTRVRAVVDTAGFTDFTYTNAYTSPNKPYFGYFESCPASHPSPTTPLLEEASPLWQAVQAPQVVANQKLAVRAWYRGPIGGDLHDPHHGVVLHDALTGPVGNPNVFLDWNFGPRVPTGLDPAISLADWMELQFLHLPFGQGRAGTLATPPALVLMARGGSETLLVGNAPPNRGVTLFAGAAPATAPAPSGSWLVGESALSVGATDAAGELLFDLNVEGALASGPLFLQARVEDPAADGGFAWSFPILLGS